MNRSTAIRLIQDVAGQKNAFDGLENALSSIPKTELNSALLECGIIPEQFEHDSSEEELWAKYCDILFAHTLSYLSIPAEVLRTRGDSADILGKTDHYSIVGDAKAFRLSRSAKNQKDFKIKALDDWRRSDTYACLVAPLYQYPTRESQIYQQALEHNVTLISYVHLSFLLDHFAGQNLKPLWEIGKHLQPGKNARLYWQTIDEVVCETIGASEAALKAYKHEEVSRTKLIGEEGIAYWEPSITT